MQTAGQTEIDGSTDRLWLLLSGTAELGLEGKPRSSCIPLQGRLGTARWGGAGDPHLQAIRQQSSELPNTYGHPRTEVRVLGTVSQTAMIPAPHSSYQEGLATSPARVETDDGTVGLLSQFRSPGDPGTGRRRTGEHRAPWPRRDFQPRGSRLESRLHFKYPMTAKSSRPDQALKLQWYLFPGAPEQDDGRTAGRQKTGVVSQSGKSQFLQVNWKKKALRQVRMIRAKEIGGSSSAENLLVFFFLVPTSEK